MSKKYLTCKKNKNYQNKAPKTSKSTNIKKVPKIEKRTKTQVH